MDRMETKTNGGFMNYENEPNELTQDQIEQDLAEQAIANEEATRAEANPPAESDTTEDF